MTATKVHRLDGLEPDNLLAFLALLGLLRALEVRERALPDAQKLRPRAAWALHAPPLRPLLVLARPVSREEIAQSAAEGIDAIAPSHEFGGAKDLNYAPEACRALLAREAKVARIHARERVDLLAALMTDGALKKKKNVVVIEPTPLAFGGGQQRFLERLTRVPHEPGPSRRGGGKVAATVAAIQCLTAALFLPWHRNDPKLSSFRWDPAEDARYALRPSDPADEPYGTQHGANRLAAVGLATLTLVPETRGGRVRPTIIGGAADSQGFSFAWPVWREPATLAAIRALLAHRTLRAPGTLAHLGVDHVMVARRIQVGDYRNVARARVLG